MADTVNVKLIYSAQLAAEASAKTDAAMVQAGTSLLQLLSECAQRQSDRFRELLFADEQQLKRGIIVATNGTQIADPAQYMIDCDAEVLVMTPIAGG